MKNITKRTLITALILALLLTSAGAAFAASNADTMSSERADAGKNHSTLPAFDEKTALANLTKIKSAVPKGGVIKGIPARSDIPYYDNIFRIDKNLPQPELVSYPGNVHVVDGNPGVVQSLGIVKPGGLEFDVINYTAEDVKIGIYKDAACQTPVAPEKVVTPEMSKKERDKGNFEYVRASIGTEAEYWIAIYADGSSVIDYQYVEAAAYYYSAKKDQTITLGNAYAIGQISRPQTNFFKFKAKKTGGAIFDVYPVGRAFGTITLCKNNKKPLSNTVKFDSFVSETGDEYYWSEAINFGVKKGRTYYIKLIQKS